MANKWWVGSVSDDVNVAGNWDPSGVPADEDTLIYNEQAQRDCLTNVTQAGKDFYLEVERGFTRKIGASALPLKPDSFRRVHIRGNSQGIYLQAGSTQIDYLELNSDSAKDDMVQIMGGSITDFTIIRGKMKLNTGVTLTGRANILGIGGDQNAILNIDSGCTLAGSTLTIGGGFVFASTTLVTALLNGGELTLEAAAGVSALLDADAGKIYWDSASSTIALARMRGNAALMSRKNATGRTLTTGHQFEDGIFDFSVGGLQITFTNGIRVHGNRPPIMPMGAKYSFAL